MNHRIDHSKLKQEQVDPFALSAQEQLALFTLRMQILRSSAQVLIDHVDLRNRIGESTDVGGIVQMIDQLSDGAFQELAVIQTKFELQRHEIEEAKKISAFTRWGLRVAKWIGII